MKSIIPDGDEKRCFICGYHYDLERHHCLFGSKRKKADEYGLTVYLCRDCHRALHDSGKHKEHLQRIAQWAFERKYGHEEYMKQFGKNYL